MDEDEIRKKLEEIRERERVLREGSKEFRKKLALEKTEERELKKELGLERKLSEEEKRIENLESKSRGFFGGSRDERIFYAFLIMVILLATIGLRTTLLRYQGFYEPDVFYHYSVVRAAVNNGFFIPGNLSISGWPAHTIINEPRGLYWVTLLPYFFLRFVGVSYFTIMRLIAVVFGILDVIGAYFLARFLSKDKFFLFLVIALVALSAGDAARTSALIYRGDSFVTIFLIAALIFMVYVFRTKTRGLKVLYAILAGVSLSLANFVWNGAPFVTIIYILSLILIEMMAFVRDNLDLMRDCIYLLASLLIWFIFVQLYVLSGQISSGSEIFTLRGFAFLYAFLVVVWYVALFIMKNNNIRSAMSRFILIVLSMVVGIVGLYLVAPDLLLHIVVYNGVVVTNTFAATIQELTPPTYNFLFASFGYALYTSPTSIIMALSSILPYGVPAISALRTELSLVFWVLMMIGLVPYLLMRVYDSGGFLKGNARIRLGADVALIVLMVYFATTGLLQVYAIRFNSLVAVPLAIFGAFMLYWITLLLKRNDPLINLCGSSILFLTLLVWLRAAFGIDVYSFIMLLLVVGVGLTAGIVYHLAARAKAFVFPMVVASILITMILSYGVLSQQYGSGIGTVLAAMALIPAVMLIYFVGVKQKRYETISYVLVVVLLMALAYYDVQFSSAVAPADSMNPQLFSAMAWLKNNSANSSVVLTLWPDGSVVEGIANRTSVTDSVGSQNLTKGDPFANWLLNSSNNPQFLTSNINGRPDYLLVRNVWLGETSGIFQESGLNGSVQQNYAYAALQSVSETINSSTSLFRFSNGQGGGPGSLNVVTQIQRNGSLISYIQAPNGISPFTYIAFYNQYNNSFNIVRQVAFNATNKQLLLIIYSPIQNPRLAINITGVFIFGNGLAQSNMLKFLYFCGRSACLWNNNLASMSLVYSNPDARIFRITYNKSA